ncbi:hypothetical protein [Stenotrophomonas maltophilia]|uniref:hypothetical protein n=1 Tax=Stenotrophomonas maltophilia TaxID=40324 RepID=UPI0011B4CD19|nr:hypothetical protein [Stenotrophomonas maltophilia]
MSSFEVSIISISDPLSPHTRSVRKSLLIASVIAIFISTTGLIPAKITALGIEFSQADRGSMLWVLGLVVAFLLMSFSVTAAADFAAWRMSFSAKAWEEESQGYDNARNSMLESRSLTDEDREELAEIERRIGSMWRNAGHVGRYSMLERAVGPISWARALIEFAFPIVAGVSSLVLLVRASP